MKASAHLLDPTPLFWRSDMLLVGRLQPRHSAQPASSSSVAMHMDAQVSDPTPGFGQTGRIVDVACPPPRVPGARLGKCSPGRDRWHSRTLTPSLVFSDWFLPPCAARLTGSCLPPPLGSSLPPPSLLCFLFWLTTWGFLLFFFLPLAPRNLYVLTCHWACLSPLCLAFASIG